MVSPHQPDVVMRWKATVLTWLDTQMSHLQKMYAAIGKRAIIGIDKVIATIVVLYGQPMVANMSIVFTAMAIGRVLIY